MERGAPPCLYFRARWSERAAPAGAERALLTACRPSAPSDRGSAAASAQQGRMQLPQPPDPDEPMSTHRRHIRRQLGTKSVSVPTSGTTRRQEGGGEGSGGRGRGGGGESARYGGGVQLVAERIGKRAQHSTWIQARKATTPHAVTLDALC